ncbi:MAG TPA: TetR/AcrR family transcriptional regulator [Chthoniobacteraceae bacterium]|jgi:TetR/AcrR family transcriptional regulator|nr:TetR/AcrR family transcriptional regulator [Chthoniobacteraceae bacterium]
MSEKAKAPARRTQHVRSEESRAKILAAAERVFARDGVDGARIDEIAVEAGVNKALLYYYFKSKERLYEAVIEEHLGEFNRHAFRVLQADGPADALLLEYVDLQFDFISRRRMHAPLFQQFMTRGAKPPTRLVRDYIIPRAEALQKLLVRGMREGALRKADPFHTAASIAALVVFYFSSAPIMKLFGRTDPYSPAGIALRKKEVRNFIRHGLFSRPDAS